MRCLRHPEPSGCCEPRVPRSVRTTAPRTGERRNCVGRRSKDRLREGDGKGRRRLHARAALASAGGHCNRARPLLDCRRLHALQRAAARRLHAQRAGGARAQRQSRQWRRAAPSARGDRVDLQLDVGHRGDRAPHRAIEGADPREGNRRHAGAVPRRVFARGDDAAKDLRGA